MVYVRKLQALLKMEFAERIIDKDPEDLKEGDHGLESRAPRRAQKAAPSDGDEAAASSQHKPRRKGRKRKAVSQAHSPRMRMTSPRMRMTSLGRWTSCSVGKSSTRKTLSRTAASSRAPHYKTNSLIISRIIRLELVVRTIGLVVRTIRLIVRTISSPWDPGG